MAQVRLSDVIIPEVYASYGEVNSPELTAFLASGIVVSNPELDAYANGPSKTGHIPYWGDLDQTIEPNYSNDDPADTITANKIGTGEFAYRKSYLNQSWSQMSLVQHLLGTEPMRRIKERTSTYWLRRLQKRVIQIAKGILAENIAVNSGDMVVNIAAEAVGSVTASTQFNSDAVVNAAFTMGDRAGGFTTIACHSMTAAQMTKNDDLEIVRDSAGQIVTRSYKGMNVIIDDSLPVRAGTTSGFVYTTMLFGRGVIGMGVGTPDAPVEVTRDATAGNGGGMDSLIERKHWLLHPVGHDWVEGSLAEFSPTDADLALAAHWVRKFDRKLIPMAFLTHN